MTLHTPAGVRSSLLAANSGGREGKDSAVQPARPLRGAFEFAAQTPRKRKRFRP